MLIIFGDVFVCGYVVSWPARVSVFCADDSVAHCTGAAFRIYAAEFNELARRCDKSEHALHNNTKSSTSSSVINTGGSGKGPALIPHQVHH